MDRKLENRELISDLADGRLGGADAIKLMNQMASDDDAALSWQVYHLSGDVLRGDWAGGGDTAGVSVGLSPDFMSRLRVRLAEVEMDPPPVALPLSSSLSVSSQRVQAEASNQPVFRWRLVAGLASVVAVVAVGWSMVGQWGPARTNDQLAVTTVPATSMQAVTVSFPGEERAVMLRDPRLDELLAAHKQVAGASALQTPAGFLRNATFEGASR